MSNIRFVIARSDRRERRGNLFGHSMRLLRRPVGLLAMTGRKDVIPVETGIHRTITIDSRLRGNDKWDAGMTNGTRE